jgi:hypothetical protein
MCDYKEGKEYLHTYLKNTGRDSDLKKLRNVPDNWLKGASTICWQARMWSRGAVLPESAKKFFEDRLKTLLNRDYSKSDKIGAEEEETKPKEKVVVPDKNATILDNLLCEIEENVDEFITTWKTNFNMYTWLQVNEVQSGMVKRMIEVYNPQLLEIEEAFNGIVNKEKIDEQLKEGYSSYTKDQLKKLYGFYVMIVEDLEQYVNNSKKERKPRAKKPITAEKKLKDFKYLQFDSMNKIQSVQPVRILGAVELWTFNVKYNQLSVFRTTDPAGLDVHRTAITNYDPVTSHTKKLRAKDVETVLKDLQGAGKVTLRTFLKNVRGSDQKLQERMNENTVLIRVVSK